MAKLPLSTFWMNRVFYLHLFCASQVPHQKRCILTDVAMNQPILYGMTVSEMQAVPPVCRKMVHNSILFVEQAFQPNCFLLHVFRGSRWSVLISVDSERFVLFSSAT